LIALLATRPEGERDELVARLRACGYRVHAAPTAVTEALPFRTPDLGRFDWVVVTSAMGARLLLDRTAAGPRPLWAAVGPRTAAELSARGIEAAAVPAQSRGVNVAGAMAGVEPLAGRRVLLARADAAAGDLPTALRAAGAQVEQLAVYHTVAGPETSRQAVAAALADPELAGVLFASGSAVRGLLRLGGREASRLPAVCIGPATSDVARREGFTVLAEAERPSVDALVAAVRRIL
jgi:uroporphyrinogen III methyltransferase/synthase